MDRKSMKHPLEDAYARLDRSEEHISELDGIVRRFLDEQYRHTVGGIRFHPQPDVPWVFRRPEAAVPGRVAILIGDAVQDMRSALDYLVFQLAMHHSGGIEQQGTQFPIESTPGGFKRRHRTATGRPSDDRGIFLVGVCPVHVAQIQSLQPAFGCDWTQTIATFSNTDKHRRVLPALHATALQVGGFIRDANTDIGPISFEDDHLVIRSPLSDEMDLQAHITLYVSVDSKASVPNQLRDLSSHVRDTLNQFKPEFERQPSPDCQFGYPGHLR